MEKNFEVYQVEGMTLKPGVFTGRDGKPTKIDEQLVKNVYENLTGPVPLYLLHDKVNDFTVKGYASKFRLDEATCQLKFDSFLFDADTQKKVALFNHDKVSPEIEYIDHGNGMVSGRLCGISFVPNPAIDGTDVKFTPIMFSKHEDDETMGNEIEFAEMKIKFENLQKDYEKLNKQHDKVVGELTSHKEMVTKLTTERDEAMGRVSKFEKIELDRKKNSLSALTNEIKTLGFKDPEKVIAGIADVDQQIAVLTGIKEGYVVNAPPTVNDSQSGQSGGGVTPESALKEVLTEMNLPPDMAALLKGD